MYVGITLLARFMCKEGQSESLDALSVTSGPFSLLKHKVKESKCKHVHRKAYLQIADSSVTNYCS
jgi:hypothetical protein